MSIPAPITLNADPPEGFEHEVRCLNANSTAAQLDELLQSTGELRLRIVVTQSARGSSYHPKTVFLSIENNGVRYVVQERGFQYTGEWYTGSISIDELRKLFRSHEGNNRLRDLFLAIAQNRGGTLHSNISLDDAFLHAGLDPGLLTHMIDCIPESIRIKGGYGSKDRPTPNRRFRLL